MREPTHREASKTSSQGAERRASRRFPLEIEVTLHSEHNFFTGFTENISEGGLFIATHQTQEVGARFSIEFTLQGLDAPFELLCEVRWVRPYHDRLDSPAGMGVRFLNLDAETERALQAFIRARDPIFYDD